MKHIKPIYEFINRKPEYCIEITTTNIKDNLKSIANAVVKALDYLSDKEIGGKEFLKEIAMTETKLGTDPNTNRTSGNAGRGVWQIDEVGFDATKDVDSHPILKKYHENLKRNGIDWDDIEWDDCNKLIYGAIAARLLIAVKPFKINENRAYRAYQWKKHYNTNDGKGTADDYWNRVRECYKRCGYSDKYANITLAQYLKSIKK